MGYLKGAVAILSFFVVLPIWYYLLYKLLQASNASDVMWLLYWVYIPVGIIVGVTQKLIEAAASE